MAETYIDIGSDKDITLTITNSSGVAQDVSGFEGYGFVLYYESDGTVLEKYAKNVVSGWSNDIDTSADSTGIVTIHLQRATTEGERPGGRVYAQCQTQETDSDHASSQFRDWGDPVYCFTFRNASISTTTDLS